MKLTVAEIARQLGGELVGSGTAVITGVAGLREARPGDLSFLVRSRYRDALRTTAASAVLVPLDGPNEAPCDLIRVPNPEAGVTQIAQQLYRPLPPPEPGIHPTAVVHPTVRLGQDVFIGPHVVLEAGVTIGARTMIGAGCVIGTETSIGADCRIYPLVTVRERVRIGNRVILHSGAVIGSDGFGYVRRGEAWEKIPQLGTVEIGDDVEIGANTTIDRARFGRTVIGQGVKIDNLVQVAHNVIIGDHTAIAAQAGLAGSAGVGRGVQIAGQAGVTNHVTVGDGATIGGQAGVTKDVPPGTFVSGYPAIRHDLARKLHAQVMLLPELRARVAELEKRLGLDRPCSGSTGEAQP